MEQPPNGSLALPTVAQRRPRTSSSEEEDGEVRPLKRTGASQRSANLNEPAHDYFRRQWDLRALVPPTSTAGDDCRIFEQFEGWRYLQSGRLGMVAQANFRGQPQRLVAVKFQLVDTHDEAKGARMIRSLQDLHRTTDGVPESQEAVTNKLIHLPVAIMPAHALEIRSWALAQYVLNPTRREDVYSNAVRIYDWARCSIQRDSIRAKFTNGTTMQARQELEQRFEPLFQKAEEKTKGARVQEIQVLAIVMEYVPGQTVDTFFKPLSGTNRFVDVELLSRPEYFLSVWTQLVCTLAYLQKRIDFAHGDAHMGNIMLMDLDKLPNHPLRNRSLRYDLPVVDQLGRESAWQFFTPPTRFLVKIIDFGLSKTRVSYPEDLELVNHTNETYSYDVPHFYLYRRDLPTAALVLLLYWANQLRHHHYRLQGNAVQLREYVVSQMPVASMLLHALGRQVLEPYGPTHTRRSLAGIVGLAYRNDAPPLHGNKTWADVLSSRASELYAEQLECIKTRSKDRAACILAHREPSPLQPGESSAGPWSIDEHLVMFAAELGGFQVGTNRKAATYSRPRWLTEHRLEDHVVMLPSPSQWPAQFYPTARRHFEQQTNAVPYPRFRGDAMGMIEFAGRNNYPSPELDAYVSRYRAEQRTHDRLYVTI